MTAAERAEASREAQGLPPRIEDAAALARLAALLHHHETSEVAA